MNRSVKRSSRSTDGVWNNSEPVSSLNQHNLTLDSDGDTMTMTPSSSSSNASSGIDEVEYVDDDNDRYGRQGVRLREPLQDRKRRNTNASHISDQRGNVKEEDDDSSGLYYATPRLNPQNQNAKTELEPLNIGEPPSPCDSCSSAHAEMIPFAKRSPLRVPISPTSPTADAEDADTETTDIERKLRERKTRNSTISAAQSPHTNRVNTTRTLPPSNTNILMSGIDFKFRNHEITEASLRVQIQAAHAHIARMSGRPSPNPNPPPISAPHSYLHPTPIPPPLAQPDDREAGLFWRSREADRRSRAAAPRDGFANDPASSSSDGTVTIDARTGMRRRVGSAPMSSPRLKRPATPYPPAEGWQGAGPEEGKRVRGLVVEIPEKGVGV